MKDRRKELTMRIFRKDNEPIVKPEGFQEIDRGYEPEREGEKPKEFKTFVKIEKEGGVSEDESKRNI